MPRADGLGDHPGPERRASASTCAWPRSRRPRTRPTATRSSWRTTARRTTRARWRGRPRRAGRGVPGHSGVGGAQPGGARRPRPDPRVRRRGSRARARLSAVRGREPVEAGCGGGGRGVLPAGRRDRGCSGCTTASACVPAGVLQVDWLGSGSLAVWREVFEKVGGFDSRLETCEDVDFCQRLRRNGYGLWSDDRLRSVHLGDPRTLRALFFGELWRGRDNLKVSLRGPLTPRALPSVLIPLTILLLLTVGAGQPVRACRAAGECWSLALAGPLLLTSLRAARMLSRHPPLRSADRRPRVRRGPGLRHLAGAGARRPHAAPRPADGVALEPSARDEGVSAPGSRARAAQRPRHRRRPREDDPARRGARRSGALARDGLLHPRRPRHASSASTSARPASASTTSRSRRRHSFDPSRSCRRSAAWSASAASTSSTPTTTRPTCWSGCCAASTAPMVLSTAHGWTGHSSRERDVYYPLGQVAAGAAAVRGCGVEPDPRRAGRARPAAPSACEVILNGIDHRRVPPRSSPRGGGARRARRRARRASCIGAVGRLEPQKRFDLLIEAFATPAPGSCRTLRLRIAGDGSLQAGAAAADRRRSGCGPWRR